MKKVIGLTVILGSMLFVKCGPKMNQESSKTTGSTSINTVDPMPYAESITADELKEMLYVYASDEFEGRNTGEPGQKKAVQKSSKAIQVRALIFDMDGTMFDSMMIHHSAWQKKLKELGLEMSLEEVKRDIHGVNSEIIKRLFGDRFSETEIKQIAWEKEAAYREIYADKIKLLPGLQDFLDRAQKLGIPLGIGTAAPGENAAFAIEALNLESYFKTVVHSDMVERGKPDPQVFQMVSDDLGIAMKDCLIFEDSPTGAKAAANGSSQSVILTTTHTPNEFEQINGIKHFMADFTQIEIRQDETESYQILF